MPDCIFCKIVNGEIPSYKLYEDNDFFGFLDIHPRTKGHTLIIPKNHYQWSYEVPNFGSYWEVVKKLTEAIQKSLSAQWVNYFTFGEIHHSHIHILPRYIDLESSEIVPKKILKYSDEEFKKIAEEIKKAL